MSKPSSTLSIATFNTWNCQGRFSRRLPLMIKGLAELQADVILLQEVFAQAPLGMHVGQRLADALDMEMHFVAARKKLRRLNGAPVLCHSGLAVLSKIPIRSAQTIKLPTDERDGERVGQCVTFTFQGRNITLGNMHLTHLPGADDLRRKQLRVMLKACSTTANMTLIGGDMNAPQGHELFDTLEGFVVPDFGDAPQPTSLNPMPGCEEKSGVIDHIFVRGHAGGKVTCKARVALNERDDRTGLYPSDHMAVVVNLMLL